MAAAYAIMKLRPSARKLIILVVEDEVLVRTVLAEDLRNHGYDIVEAANADEALSILQSNTGIDLVITDKRMPGSLDGVGLARVIRADHRHIGLIMISGDPLQAEVTDVLDAYLSKPCRVPELLAHVRALSPYMDQ
jgi:CheY-like chemotaxis protein